MRRITLFSFDFAPLDGGIARLCTELGRGLAGRGLEVSVLTAPNGAATAESGVTRLAGSRLMRDARALRLLAQLPADELVLCGRWYPEALLALLSGRRKIAILTHGAELLASRVAWLSAPRDRARRHVLEAARLVLANSRYTAELTGSVAPRASVIALPLGVDVDAFSPGDRQAARDALGLRTRFVISTVARVQSFKGHDTVITALAQLPSDLRAQFTYVVAGRGGHTPALLELSRQLGVSEQVKFVGLVPEALLPNVYRASDLFCLMTRSAPRAVEGFGLALLEAQSCGIPVLGSSVGGIPDAVVDSETGFLLAPGDVGGVERHLLRLVQEPELYRSMGRAARARAVACCSWQAYAEKLVRLLERNGSDAQPFP